MSIEGIILIAIAVGLAFCPAKYDPAIRLKEWLLRKRGSPR